MPSTAVRDASDRDLLRAIVDEGYYRQTWAGMNVRKALRGVTAAAAAWRPPHGRHSIAEIVLHLAYWKVAVAAHLLGEPAAFPLKGRDWFETPAAIGAAQWERYLKLLAAAHRRFRRAVESLDLRPTTKAGRDRASHVYGLAMHDMYHAGQIAMIRAQHGRTRGGR
jgi:hypothetical protein